MKKDKLNNNLDMNIDENVAIVGNNDAELYIIEKTK